MVPIRKKGAEQAERALGDGQRKRQWAEIRNPRWNVILLQTAIVMIVEDLRPKHASPPIRFYTDIYTHNSAITDNNTDKKLEDQNHNGRIEEDNGDGIYQKTEKWKGTSELKFKLYCEIINGG